MTVLGKATMPFLLLALAAPAGADQASVARGSNAFALDLYAKLRDAQEGNLFFSPFSVSTALAMTYAGARGETAAQMAKVLHLGLDPERLHPAFGTLVGALNAGGKSRGYELSVANALWGQKGHGFRKEFLDLLHAHYGAGLHEADFAQATEAARQTINRWVEEQTHDKIKNLLAPGILTPLTRLVLTNAIYFRGDWASQFKKAQTFDQPFTLSNGEKTRVPMMSQTADFPYGEEEGFQAIELPYKGEELAMVALLPRKPDGLGALEKSLAPDRLAAWLAKLERQEVVVAVPRFKVTSELKLADVLAALGMRDAFALPPADLSGMTGTKDLFLNTVVHKAYVDVNETGTEAAAATGAVAAITAVRPRVVFRADHPFLFLIRERRSGALLFLGRVVNPKE